MIAKEKGDGTVTPVFTMSDGTLYTGLDWNNEFSALTETMFRTRHDSLAKLRETHNILPLTLKNLTIGDLIVHNDRHFRRILSADGVGDTRLYSVSIFDSDTDRDRLKKYSSSYTALELKNLGYKPVQPESEPIRELTVSEVCERLGYEVKIRKE